MAIGGDCISCSGRILVLRRVRDLIGIFGFIDLHFLLDICDENVPEWEKRLPQLGHPVWVVKEVLKDVLLIIFLWSSWRSVFGVKERHKMSLESSEKSLMTHVSLDTFIKMSSFYIFFPQWEKWNLPKGFSPEWMRKCSFRWCLNLKAFPHSSHLNRRRSVDWSCEIMCRCKR